MPAMNRTLCSGLLVCLAAAGCGPHKPSNHAGETVFWKINASNTTFTDCTDDPAFRSQLPVFAADAGNFLVYKVDGEGKRATVQNCNTRDPTSCSDNTTGLVFDIAGSELNFSRDSKAAIGTGGCQLQVTQSWLLTDQETKMSLEISDIFSLIDNPTDCDRVQTQLQAQAPNHLGLQGCVVRFLLGGTRE